MGAGMQEWSVRRLYGPTRMRPREAPFGPVPKPPAEADDEAFASYEYEGPHGPAYVAYYDGFARTRVWGEGIPESRLEDGPYVSPRTRCSRADGRRSSPAVSKGTSAAHLCLSVAGCPCSSRIPTRSP